MNINWKLKSHAFHWIDIFSLQRALYFLQRHVTKRATIDISAVQKNWFVHRDNLKTLEHPKVFEFGAGQNLSQNIFLSQYFDTQTVVDLFAMLNIDLVNDAALRISKVFSSIQFHPMENISELEQYYRVRYLAPFDASKTPFDDSSFDACVSTSTLEHVPKDAILSIFSELRRIIRPDGLISAIIDYSDHYSHTDRSIGRLNYLQYSTESFRKYNHRSHYQNRLRHYDYEEMFLALGYRCILSEATNYASPPSTISDEFDKSQPTLCSQRGIFLLQNIK